jgi:hypothetical protein
MKRSRAYEVSIPLAIAVSLFGAAALAASAKDEAKQHFDAGNALVENEDYAAAAAEFELSVGLYPTKMGLFNLANSYKALNRYGDALDALSRLQREFAGKLGELAAEVASLKNTIEGMVGRVSVRVDRDGATVSVDDLEVGTSPLAKPLVLAPGEHVIGARLSGYEEATQHLRVVARARSEVAFALVPAAAPAPQPGAYAPAPTSALAAGAPTPSAAPPAKPIVDDEAAVAAAVGKDLSRPHAVWLRSRTARYPRFSDYMYDFYEGKKRGGVVLAAVLGPVFLVAGGVLSGVMFGMYGSKTTCDVVLNYDPDCKPVESFRIAGAVFAGVFGAAAVTVIAVGAAKASANKKRMRKIDALRQVALREPKLEFVGFAPLADTEAKPSGLALQWTF